MTYKNKSNLLKISVLFLLAAGALWVSAATFKYYYLMSDKEILALHGWAQEFTKSILVGVILLLLGIIGLIRCQRS